MAKAAQSSIKEIVIDKESIVDQKPPKVIRSKSA
jgi:hypothetical protein